jgi:replicative DNA helicase
MFVDRPGYYKNEENYTPDGQDHSQTPTDSDGRITAEPAYIYLAKNRHGPMGKDPVWWIPSKTLFYEYNEKDPQDPNGKLVRSVSADAAAQNYDFVDEADDEPEMDPPLSEDEGAQQDDETFMAYAHDQFPEGFI